MPEEVEPLDDYKKEPRVLAKQVLDELTNGRAKPILQAVKTTHKNKQLRFEIRSETRFNVYYRGGSILRVNGRKRNGDWDIGFNMNYFANSDREAMDNGERFADVAVGEKWVDKIATLMKGMDNWWAEGNKKGEREDCHLMACGNSDPCFIQNYLILDTEYAWGRRRYIDLVAAKQNPTTEDPKCWKTPHLVFIEVKCELKACTQKASGLMSHYQDYRNLCRSKNPYKEDETYSDWVKKEFKELACQKIDLGILDEKYRIDQFSRKPPELLFVFIGLDPNIIQNRAIRENLKNIYETSCKDELSGNIFILFMDRMEKSYSEKYRLPVDKVKPLGEWIKEG
jgi:hypothetical protein